MRTKVLVIGILLAVPAWIYGVYWVVCGQSRSQGFNEFDEVLFQP